MEKKRVDIDALEVVDLEKLTKQALMRFECKLWRAFCKTINPCSVNSETAGRGCLECLKNAS